ncbi:MAG: hypothetical protein KIT83_00450 [Bryobacterales bacterium]|nr:hypothetical protein [Bryobacterales bacterium]
MSVAALQHYMRDIDIEAFRSAAAFYNVFLLLRRTNVESKPYIGVFGYSPKRLDCKAKTADCNVFVPGIGERQTAGLVVNPTLPGFQNAFQTSAKAISAQETWRQFSPLCYFPELGRALTYIPGGRFYTVQMDPAHKHYGCVQFASNSLISAAKYVHGDYDLYAIVPAEPAPGSVPKGSAVAIRVTETRHGQPHARGREFFDVQHYLNRKMGVAMVLHGDQEKYAAHTDEPVDVFWPDNREPTVLNTKAEIEQFYTTHFQGREPFHKGIKGPHGTYVTR